MSGRFAGVAAAVLLASLGVGWGIGQFRKTPKPTPAIAADTKRGPVLYQVYCASCHGPDGHGDGPSAAALRPPPRTFAARPWRNPVTTESIRRVIVQGLPGTAMAANPALSPADLEPLAEHVLHLANQPAPPVTATHEQEMLRDASFLDLQGTNAPPLQVVDAANRTSKLSDWKGKLVLVHFWGINCLHCLKEFPRWKSLEEQYASRGLVVLHICTDADEAADAQSLADRHASGLKVLVDDTGLANARFEVQALPTTWLIDPDSRPIARTTGARDWNDPKCLRVLEHWLPQPR